MFALVIVAVTVVYDAASHAFLRAVLRDHLRNFEARQRAETAAEEAKHRFVRTVSHEVRTPLNAVLGSAALLADTALSEEQRELVGMLEAGANNVVVIIDDILQINALETANFRARGPLFPLLPFPSFLP